jgi:hypothetical protein
MMYFKASQLTFTGSDTHSERHVTPSQFVPGCQTTHSVEMLPSLICLNLGALVPDLLGEALLLLPDLWTFVFATRFQSIGVGLTPQ